MRWDGGARQRAENARKATAFESKAYRHRPVEMAMARKMRTQ
jgi:hypothetical protein